MAALFNFEAAEGHADATGAISEGVGFAAGLAFVYGLRAAELDNATVPEGGMLPLGTGEVAEDLSADGVSVAVGESEIGVVGLDLGLPVGFKGLEDLFELCGTEDRCGQGCAPGYL
jgi:hypothetical protein